MDNSLMLAAFCHLCGNRQTEPPLIKIRSEQGRKDHLETLLNEYILSFIPLPKDDTLCLCNLCKTRLLEWDSFIKSCKRVQAELRKTCLKGIKDKSNSNQKRCIDFISSGSANVTNESPQKKRSSNYCIARWCNKGNYQGVSLFRLPRDRARALSWLLSAERSDLQCMPSLNSYYLCANHFTSNMFTNKACNQLIKKAIPTVFPKSPYAEKTSQKAAASLVIPKKIQGTELKSILPKTNLPHEVTSSYQSKKMPEGAQQPACFEKPKHQNSVILQFLPQSHQENSWTERKQDSEVVLEVLPPEKNANCNIIQLLVNPPISNTSFNVVPIAPASIISESQPKHDVGGEVVSNIQSESEWCSTRLNPKLNARAESVPTSVPSSWSETELSQVNRERHPDYLLADAAQKDIIEEEVHFSEVSSDPHGFFVIDRNLGDNIDVESKQRALLLKRPTSSEVFESGTTSLYGNSNSVIVGSQDLLLPHSSNQVLSSSSLTVHSNRDASGNAISEVPRELGTVLNQLCLSNSLSNRISIFDLQTDEMQGADTSSYISSIENFDELVDLDHYFEGK